MSRKNPFSYTVPTQPADFVGRWALVEQIVADVCQPHADSWAIIGGRRFGKSSVLKAIQSRLFTRLRQTDAGERHVLPLMVDLKRCETQNKEQIYACIVRQFYRALRRQPALPKVAALPQLPKATDGRTELSFYDFEELLDEVTLRFEEHNSPLRLLLLLDEAEFTVQFAWSEALFNQLRALIYDGPLSHTVKLILTGSARITEVRHAGSPLLNAVKICHLHALSPADVAEIMARGGQIPDKAAAAVQKQSGGHPFIAQYLLHHLWQQGFTDATPARVEQVARQMRQERAADLQGWWDAIGESGQRTYATLTLVAHQEWRHERQLLSQAAETTQTVAHGLSALCYHGLVERSADWQQYRRAGSLFQSWFWDRKASTAPATSNEMPTFKAHAELVELLLAIPSIADRDRRATLIDQLPTQIKTNIAYNSVDRSHLFNILKTCLQYPNGMQELKHILQFFEGPSIPMQRFEEALNR